MANHICPWWMGYLLANPLRKIIQNPTQILLPYIQPDMKVLDIGCGMGFFTIPMAKLVGDSGKAYGVDIQYKMLKGLKKRAYKAGVVHSLETIECDDKSFCLQALRSKINFVLLFAVIHEVPDSKRAFEEVISVLVPNGRILFSEPSAHVSIEQFEGSVDIAQKCGLKVSEKLNIRNSHSVLLMSSDI